MSAPPLGRVRARVGLAVGAMAWLAAFSFLSSTAAQTIPGLATRTATADDALAAPAAVLGLGVLSWLAVGLVVTVLAAVLPIGHPGRRTARRISAAVLPGTARRLLTVIVGAALMTGAGATAAGAAQPRVGLGATAAATVHRAGSGGEIDHVNGSGLASSVIANLDPGWLPSPGPILAAPRPGDGRATAPLLDPAWGTPGRARPGVHPTDSVVVRRGDTLWDIAARHLGPAATDAEIARAWPRWFNANRATIGADPDRLSPGQQLRPPTPLYGGSP